MSKFVVERVLFVIGAQNHGKSSQIRHILQDVRLHTDGVVPQKVNVKHFYRISNERALILRLSSPHEMDENIDEYFEGSWDQKFINYAHQARRWNVVGALQPYAHKNMPDASEVIEAIFARYNPERIRTVLLNPNRFGHYLDPQQQTSLVDNLWAAGAEVISIDARHKAKNGLILADFFDFT